MADRFRHQPSKLDRRVRFPQGTLHARGWANGTLPGFEPGDGGSIPSPRAYARERYPRRIPGQLLLVVTPGSEPGGRWFDSNPRSLLARTEVIRPDEDPVLKTGGGTARLWVRVPRLPLLDDTIRVPGVIGSTAGSNPVGQGSSPWGRALLAVCYREPLATKWAHGPTGRHQLRKLGIRVRLPVGPQQATTTVPWPSGEGSTLTR